MSTGSISSLGIGSGLDLQDIIDQLREVDEEPITAKETQKTTLEEKLSEFSTIQNSLLSIRTKARELSLGSSYLDKGISVSGTSVSATSLSGATETSHSVNVTSVARNSTWVSDEVSSESDSIATTNGTFSYKVGQDGTTISLAVSAGTTLEELVEQINDDDSNPGVTASIAYTGIGDNPYKLVLSSDETGEDNRIYIESELTDLQMTETIGADHFSPESDQEVTISATEPLDISAASGNNEIVFREKLADGEYGDEVTATIADGSYTSGEDLAAAMESAMESASINGTDYSVAFDSETNKFTISSDDSDMEAFQIEWGSSSAAAALGFDAETDTYDSAGSSLNASFNVDGIDYERQSNSDITDVIPGISLELNETGSSSITVESDFESITTLLQDIVDAINTISSDMDSKSEYDIDTGESGVLFGENSVLSIDDELKAFLTKTFNINDTITSLADLGLEMDEDGVLSIDTETLEDALAANAEDIIKFFTGDSETGTDGFADLLYDKMSEYSGANGSMTATIDSTETRIEDMEEDIEKATDLLDKKYETLTARFVQMDLYISKMEAQGTYMDQIFNSDSSD